MPKITAIEILNAFNASDNFSKFLELLSDTVSPEDINKLYTRLDTQFRHFGPAEFLKLSATKRQAELLIANGSLWSHRNMFNALNALRNQKELEPEFIWVTGLIRIKETK